MKVLQHTDLMCTTFSRMLRPGENRFDENEFIAVYNRHRRQLQNVILGFADDDLLAEDIVQDVFLSIWERREDLHIDSWPAYLTRSVKLAGYKSLKANRLHQKLLSQYYKPEVVQWDETVIHAGFLEEYLLATAEKLPERCKAVFKLSRQKGLTTHEIAASMSISAKTVEAHLTRALRVLRYSLE